MDVKPPGKRRRGRLKTIRVDAVGMRLENCGIGKEDSGWQEAMPRTIDYHCGDQMMNQV